MMKKEVIILVVLTSILVLILSFLNLSKNKEVEKLKTLKIGSVTLNIEVADTNMEREQGLSGREGLRENEGLLFVFETEGYYGFWMKDMNFPIDIAWLDKNKKIIHIESDVSPATYPKVFNPNVTSLYVLEIPAGFLVKNNVKIGDQVAF